MADILDLLTAAAALLILGLGLNVPGLTRRIPRVAWSFAGLGAMLPLLDPLIARLIADDQIGALIRPPLFAGPLVGLGLILALVLAVAIWSGLREAMRTLPALAAGYALNLLLAATQAPGVPWAVPFISGHWGWSLFPQGHLVLIALLVVSLVTLEALNRRVRWLHWVPVGVIGVYVGTVLGGYAWAAAVAPPLTSTTARRTIEPDGWSPLAWRVVDEMPGEYRVTLLALGEGEPTQAKPVARWNDQALLLAVLDDPVVFRLYRRAFLHPVAEVAVSSSQTTLTVQELSQRLTGVQGPTFVLKTDSDGRNRLYRLERFD